MGSNWKKNITKTINNDMDDQVGVELVRWASDKTLLSAEKVVICHRVSYDTDSKDAHSVRSYNERWWVEINDFSQ